METLLELTSRAEASHFWFRGFRRFVLPLLDRALSGAAGLTLLDCGCGTGYNLRHLTRYATAFGIDVSPAGLLIARRAGGQVARADVTRLPFSSERFDVVTSFDVLQCVSDDREAVREIARVLRPGGRLVGTVAALDVLHGDHSLLSEEVRRYTRDGLARLLVAAGLEVVVVRYAFATLVPMLLVTRALQRWRGARAAGREISVPPSPINAALTALVTTEAALARYLSPPFGSSIVFLAVRR